MAIVLNTDATIPTNTSLTVTVNEDTDGDGAAENTETLSIGGGTNQYTLSNIQSVADNDHWLEVQGSKTDITLTASLNSAEVTTAEVTTIPDSGDLHSRYDFSDDSTTTSSVHDLTGNGYDLSGTFTSFTTINGVQAGEFDGTDDEVSASWTAVSQPITIAIVYLPDELDKSGDGGEVRPYDGGASAEMTHTVDADDHGYRIYAGSAVDGGSPSLSPTLSLGVFDGASSVHRINGTQVASGDVGANSLSGFILGAFANLGRYMDVNIGEVLIYDADKSGSASEIESYLADKWGITV